jgi:hypothetical protein
MPARHRGTTTKKSFKLDPVLLEEARRATGAKDDTDAVRLALEQVAPRARLRRWIRKVAGKGKFDGYDE